MVVPTVSRTDRSLHPEMSNKMEASERLAVLRKEQHGMASPHNCGHDEP